MTHVIPWDYGAILLVQVPEEEFLKFLGGAGNAHLSVQQFMAVDGTPPFVS